MKKILNLFLATAIVFSLVACGNEQSQDKLKSPENTIAEKGVAKEADIDEEIVAKEDIDENIGKDDGAELEPAIDPDSSVAPVSYEEIESKIEKEVETTIAALESEMEALTAVPEADTATSKADTVTSESEAEDENSSMITDGIRPEFKEAMDSYELFFDEYVKFMKKYKEAKDITSMMSEYSSMMKQYIDTMAALQEIGESELSDKEAFYYAEVMLRISQKLLEAA